MIGALFMLFPVLWMAMSTFKPEAEMNAYPPSFLPKRITLEPLIDAWTKINFGRYFLNSLLVTGIATPVSVFTSAYIGFVWNKYEFRYKETMFYVIIATMMIPGPMLLIPHYAGGAVGRSSKYLCVYYRARSSDAVWDFPDASIHAWCA